MDADARETAGAEQVVQLRSAVDGLDEYADLRRRNLSGCMSCKVLNAVEN